MFFLCCCCYLIAGDKRSPQTFLGQRYSKSCMAKFSRTVHLLAMLLLYRLTRMVCGREGRGVEYKVRLMSQLSRECTCT